MKTKMSIFNLRKKKGQSVVKYVMDVFVKMGAHQRCDDVMDVVRLRQREDGTIVCPIIVEFRS